MKYTYKRCKEAWSAQTDGHQSLIKMGWFSFYFLLTDENMQAAPTETLRFFSHWIPSLKRNFSLEISLEII